MTLSSPHNPLLEVIFNTAIRHYHLQVKDLDDKAPYGDIMVAGNNTPPCITYAYDETEYILMSTPNKTGPYCIRKNVVNDGGDLKNISDDGTSAIQSMNNLTSYPGNAQGWVGRKISPLSSREAIRKITQTIEFELNNFGLLRLDDHINNLIAATDCSIQEAANGILAIISRFDLKTISSIQHTFVDNQTIEFCESEGLLNKTYLFPLVKECDEKGENPRYYMQPVASLMKTDEVIKLTGSLNDSQLNADEYLEKIKKITTSISIFTQKALQYCEGLMQRIQERSGSDVHMKIVSGFLHYINDNIIIIMDTSQQFSLPLDHPLLDRFGAVISMFKDRSDEIDEFINEHKLNQNQSEELGVLDDNNQSKQLLNNNGNGGNDDDDKDDSCKCRIT